MTDLNPQGNQQNISNAIPFLREGGGERERESERERERERNIDRVIL